MVVWHRTSWDKFSNLSNASCCPLWHSSAGPAEVSSWDKFSNLSNASCCPLWHSSAGPAEVSFAGTFAVGLGGGADLNRAKFQRSSSFRRSRLRLFCGISFPTCPIRFATNSGTAAPGRQKSPSRGLSPLGLVAVQISTGRNSDARRASADPSFPDSPWDRSRRQRRPLEASPARHVRQRAMQIGRSRKTFCPIGARGLMNSQDRCA